MSYERLLKDNLIKRQRPDSKQIESQLLRARKDLRTAESVLTVDVTWAFTIAYHAMIRASRALMYSKGFLPTAQRSHKTIVEFAELVLGAQASRILTQSHIQAITPRKPLQKTSVFRYNAHR